ncbi:hypothetical protein Emed_005320 [Eimeria media]
MSFCTFAELVLLIFLQINRIKENISREHKEGPSISQTTWGALALCGLLRTEVPPLVPCLRVFRGPLEAPCCGQGGPPSEGSRLLLDLFEKHAGEGDLLGLLPSTGRGTNAMCEVLANHLLRSPSLLPCVETLASLQGASPLMPLHISRAYARRGQLEQALSPLLRCLSAYPEEACLLRQLAELLLRGGLYEQAAKAAAFAVELCPTVQRYWLTLARAEIACGRYEEALFVLNAAPAVSVSAPRYTAGLPSNIKELPTTQPRQRGFGFYSFLWTSPVEPILIPFTPREEGMPSPAANKPAAAAGTAAAAAAGGGGGGGRSAAAAALLRSPTFALAGDKGDSLRRSVSSYSLSFTPPLRPLISPRPSKEGGGPRVKGAPLRKQLHLGEQEGGGPPRHAGFGGAPFGLARGLDEARLLRRHWEMILHKEKHMHAESEDSGEVNSSDVQWSINGPLDHLQIVRRMRMLKLDLSEKRRYAVLVSLYKRIGLGALRRMVKRLFLLDSPDTETEGGPPPDTGGGGPLLAAAGAPTAANTPRDEAQGPPTEAPTVSSSRGQTADRGLETSVGNEQEGGPPSLLSRGGPPVGLARSSGEGEGPSSVSGRQEDYFNEIIPQENSNALRVPPSLSSPAAVSPAFSATTTARAPAIPTAAAAAAAPAPAAAPAAPAAATITARAPAIPTIPAAAAAPAAATAAAAAASAAAGGGGQEKRQSVGIEETVGLCARASSSFEHSFETETCRGGPPINDNWGAPPNAAQGPPEFAGERDSEDRGASAVVPRRLSSSFAALLAGLEEDISFSTKTKEALPWLLLSRGPPKGGGPPEAPREEGQSPSIKEVAIYWLFR